jgi:CBS-domain-containing membrane protein
MRNLPGRLGSLRARDVMTRDVVVLRDDDTIASAVLRLRERNVTGGPVVDATGVLVGLLSIVDLVQPRSGGRPPSESAGPLAPSQEALTWDLIETANPLDGKTGAERVGDRMSRQITSVPFDAPLVEVARVMCEGHWHRVPVVKRSGALCGIISSMDMLAALVNAADELGEDHAA